jgi:site-specific recombinase XerD
VSADCVGRLLSRALGPGVSGHQLRHRFASSAYGGTLDLRAVQTVLGHRSMQTTQRYVQCDRAAQLAAVLAA